MTAKILSISPAKAKKFLACADNVRRPNRNKIAHMTKDMKNGDWEQNFAPIRFKTVRGKDVLIDGQNRLFALIAAKKTIKFLIVNGCEGMTYIDTGEKRTFTQMLRHDNVPYSNACSSTVGNLLRIEWYISQKTEAPRASHSDRIRRFAADKKAIVKWAEATHNSSFVWASAVAAVLTKGTCTREYPGAKEDFVHFLSTGKDMEANDPVLVLREEQIRDGRSISHKMSSRFKLAIITKAWNAHRLEQDVEKLTFKPLSGERFPVVQ